ncbi:unnamed protein product, partial [Polarella glacialis]
TECFFLAVPSHQWAVWFYVPGRWRAASSQAFGPMAMPTDVRTMSPQETSQWCNSLALCGVKGRILRDLQETIIKNQIDGLFFDRMLRTNTLTDLGIEELNARMSLAIRRSWTTDFNCVSFIDYAASQAHFQSRVSEEDPRRQQRRGPGGQDAASEEDPRRQRRGPGQDFQNFQPDVHQAPPQDFRYGRGNAAPSQLGGADRTVAAGARPKVSARDRGWAPPVELGHASSPFGEGLGPPPPMGSPGAAGGGRGENFALGSRRDRREDPPYMNSMDQMAPPYAGDSHGGYDAQAYGGRPAAVLQDSFNGNDARGSQGNLFGQRRQQFSHDEGPPQQQQPRWAQARGPPAVPDVPFRGSHGGRDGGYPDQGSYADRGGYPNQGGYSDRGGGYQDRGYPDQGRPDQGYDHGYPDQGQMDMRDSMQDRQMPRGPGGGGGGQQPQQRRQAGGGKAGGFPGEAFGEASIDHFRNGASRAAPHGSSPGDLWGGQGPDNASRPYGEAPSMPRGAPLSMPGRMQQDTQADAYAEDYDEPRRAENNSKGRRDPNAGSSAFSGMSLEDSLVPKRTERAVDRPPPAVEENDFFGRGNQMQAGRDVQPEPGRRQEDHFEEMSQPARRQQRDLFEDEGLRPGAEMDEVHSEPQGKPLHAAVRPPPRSRRPAPPAADDGWGGQSLGDALAPKGGMASASPGGGGSSGSGAPGGSKSSAAAAAANGPDPGKTPDWIITWVRSLPDAFVPEKAREELAHIIEEQGLDGKMFSAYVHQVPPEVCAPKNAMKLKAAWGNVLKEAEAKEASLSNHASQNARGPVQKAIALVI